PGLGKVPDRSGRGPWCAWWWTIRVPADDASRPARMLSTVVLPQPEWPITQANSPRGIDSQRSSNTVVTPPPGAGKRLVTPSIEMNFSVMPSVSSLRKRHQPRRPREQLVEDHADDADHQDGSDHVGDRQVVPFVPHEIADASAADEHLGGDDHQPGDADRDAHAGEDGRRRRRQDDAEGTPDRTHLPP